MDSGPPSLPRHMRTAAPRRTPGTSEKAWFMAAAFDQHDRGVRDAEHENLVEEAGLMPHVTSSSALPSHRLEAPELC